MEKTDNNTENSSKVYIEIYSPYLGKYVNILKDSVIYIQGEHIEEDDDLKDVYFKNLDFDNKYILGIDENSKYVVIWEKYASEEEAAAVVNCLEECPVCPKEPDVPVKVIEEVVEEVLKKELKYIIDF